MLHLISNKNSQLPVAQAHWRRAMSSLMDRSSLLETNASVAPRFSSNPPLSEWNLP
ncbi:unnamed protein product, partial [Strongylus vulgaris]